MSQALIKIVYRQAIDASSISNDFEKAAFHASYQEFLLKSQAYNPDGKLDTFTELKQNDGRANSLHYKTGFSVSGYIGLLHKKIPNLQNTLGDAVLFDTYKFELVESSVTDRNLHSFAIHYITGTLTLVNSFGNVLLLAYGDKSADPIIEDSFMLQLGNGLSITSYRKL